MKKPQNVADGNELVDITENGSPFWLGFIEDFTAISRAFDPLRNDEELAELEARA